MDTNATDRGSSFKLPESIKNKKMLLIVGGARCGTTSLHAAFTSTALFQDAGVKEHHFWDSYFSINQADEKLKGWSQNQISNYSKKQIYNNRSSLRKASDSDKLYLMDLRNNLISTPQNYWYQYEYCFQNFGDCQFMLDSTPAYSLLNTKSLLSLKEHCPDNLFIIFIIKDPVKRFISGVCKSILDNSDALTHDDLTICLHEKLVKFSNNPTNNIQYKKSQLGTMALKLKSIFSSSNLMLINSEKLFDARSYDQIQSEIKSFLSINEEVSISIPCKNRNSFKPVVAKDLRSKLGTIFGEEYKLLNTLTY